MLASRTRSISILRWYGASRVAPELAAGVSGVLVFATVVTGAGAGSSAGAGASGTLRAGTTVAAGGVMTVSRLAVTAAVSFTGGAVVDVGGAAV